MHDSFNESVIKVDALLLPVNGVRRLTEGELGAYKRDYVAGWEIPVDLPNHKLRLLLNINFPYGSPRAALWPAPKLLTWPHVEENGHLCVWQERTSHDYTKVESVVSMFIQEALVLVQECISGINLTHFEDELISYWERYVRDPHQIVSLCTPSGVSRQVLVCYLQSGRHVLAETRETLRHYLNNKFGGEVSKKLTISESVFIWPRSVWRPREYPSNVGDLFRLLKSDINSLRLLSERLLDVERVSQSILLGFQTSTGAAIVGTRIIRPQKQKGQGDPITRGFRGLVQVPRDIFLTRYSVGEVLGISVNRQDPSWVHGRDQNLDMPRMQESSIVILGIGSIGSSIATLLARAGIGKITLIDKEILESENSSRHELGNAQIGRPKALELANKIAHDFPHIEVKGLKCSWQDVYKRNPDIFFDADLVISSIGEWSADSMLDDKRKQSERFPPVIFGWTEPHACIGHAILMKDKMHCLQSVCTPLGEALLPIATWENVNTRRQTPACGGQFQPYGAVELSHVHALISDLALDVINQEITSSTHRVWLGRTKLLEKTGGKWNPEWIAQHGNPGIGGQIIDLPMSQSVDR